MTKKYIVRLTSEERQTLREIVKKQQGSSPKARPAQMLLKTDADGPAWTDAHIADVFDSRTRTVHRSSWCAIIATHTPAGRRLASEDRRRPM